MNRNRLFHIDKNEKCGRQEFFKTILPKRAWVGLVGVVLAGIGWLAPAQAEGALWRQFKQTWPQLWIQKYPCQVGQVIDGDTVHVMCNGRKEKLRLVGIDTPETKHPFKPVEYYGPEASARAKELMPVGMDLWLAFTERPQRGQAPRDKYKRVLAYLFFRDGRMFNALMIKEGYAFAMRRFPHAYMSRFIALENQAKRAKRGMWAEPEKVRSMQEADNRFRKHRIRCIRQMRSRRSFRWVIGDRQQKVYLTKRHRAYFRTNPTTRVLFCSTQEAQRKGYQPASPSYRGESHRSRRADRGNRGRSRFQDRVASGDKALIVGYPKSKTYRVFKPGTYRIFNSVEDAKAAGYKARVFFKRGARKGRKGKVFKGPAKRPDCGGKDPVVANRRSKKYRTPTMKGYARAAKSKAAVFFCTEEQAKEAGYTKIKGGKGKRKKPKSE